MPPRSVVYYAMQPGHPIRKCKPIPPIFTREPYTRITTWFGDLYRRPTNQKLIPLNLDDEIAAGNPNDDIIEETADTLTVARKEQVQVGTKAPARTHVCTYEKIPAENGRTHFLQEVACIQL